MIFAGFALAFIMLSDPNLAYGRTVAKLFTIMLGDFDQVGMCARHVGAWEPVDPGSRGPDASM